MDITTLENWLWEAACAIRGPLDAPKFKDYILPLLLQETAVRPPQIGEERGEYQISGQEASPISRVKQIVDDLVGA